MKSNNNNQTAKSGKAVKRMPDREKVVKELEFCLNVGKCTACEYSKGRMFTTCRHIIEDAEELLKEQAEKLEHLNNITLEYEKEVFRLQNLLKEQEEQIGVLKRAITQRPKPVKLLDAFGDGYAKVVRCKDCRYCTIAADKKWRQDFGKSIYECDHKGLCYVEPDWFCADGERRTDNA